MKVFYLTFGLYMGLAVFSYLLLLVVSYYGDFQYRRGTKKRAQRLAELNENPPGITIVAPAKNEEAIIKPSVDALLNVPYPNLSLVVVDDGSTDKTFDILRRVYKLVERQGEVSNHFPHMSVLSVWSSEVEPRLTVVKKVASNHSKGDASNAGLEVVSTEYVLITDIDSVLEPDTIHKLVVRQRETGADAVGCAMRPLNGCAIQKDGTVRIGLPRGYWAFAQLCEYIRTFQLRQGWAAMGTLNIISGAGGFFKLTAIQRIGGFRTDTPAEDLASTWRLYLLGMKTAYEPSTNIYTQVPDTCKSMASQRKRWARGLMQILLVSAPLLLKGNRHSFMLVWLWLFELAEPFIEAMGIGVIAFKIASHTMPLVGWYWIAAGVSLTPILSIFCIVQMERCYRRMSLVSTLSLLMFSFVEVFPIKLPLSLYWRLAGTVQHLTGNRTWEPLPRQTFSEEI